MSRVLVRPELTLTIPATVLAQLGWSDHTVLELEVRDGCLLVREPSGPAQSRAKSSGLVRPAPGAPGPSAPSPSASAPGRRLDERGRPVIEGNAARVLQHRLDAGLTRTELALGVDVPYETITAWEEGWSQPSDAEADRIALALQDPELTRDRARERQPLGPG